MEEGVVQWILENRETWKAICGVEGKWLTKDEFYDLLDMTIRRSRVHIHIPAAVGQKTILQQFQ